MSTEIEIYVSDAGAGDMISVVVPPYMREWQYFNLSIDDARLLIAKLVKATNLAETNQIIST